MPVGVRGAPPGTESLQFRNGPLARLQCQRNQFAIGVENAFGKLAQSLQLSRRFRRRRKRLFELPASLDYELDYPFPFAFADRRSDFLTKRVN